MEKLKQNLFTILASAALSAAVSFAALAGYALKQVPPQAQAPQYVQTDSSAPDTTPLLERILNALESKAPAKVGATTNATCQIVSTSQSTSTMAFMTPGTGTTTLNFNTDGCDQIDLSIIKAASSTLLANLRYRVEHSDNLSLGYNGGDYFADEQTLAVNASTTPVSGLFADYSINPAATSTAGSGNASSTVNRQFGITTEFMHLPPIQTLNSKAVRVIFYDAGAPSATNANLSLWAQGKVKHLFTQ